MQSTFGSVLKFLLRLLLLSILIAGFWFLSQDFQHLFERDWIDAHVRGHGITGFALFLAFGAMLTACGFSRQAVGFLGGYAFGAWLGLALSLLASLAGCVLTFYFARWFGRSLVDRWLPGKLRRFDRLVQAHPFGTTLTIRLLPVGSNLVTNLLAGVSRIPRTAFFAASLVGYVPQTLIFTLAGSGLTIGSRWQLAVSLTLLAVSAAIGTTLYRRVRAQSDYAGDLQFSRKGEA